MKFLLLGLIFVSISYIGIKFGGAYKQKEIFYNEFINFITYIKNQIGFFKTDILEILDSYKTKNKDILMLIKNYKNYLKNEKFENLQILSDEENNEILNFLKGIGKNDCLTQNEFLEKNFEYFNIKFTEAKNLNLKYGNLYKKLGILLGIFVCILLI